MGLKVEELLIVWKFLNYLDNGLMKCYTVKYLKEQMHLQ